MKFSTARVVLLTVAVFNWVHGFVRGAEPLPLVPIGAAKVDISPSYPIRLTGYGSRKTEAEEVAQRIWAKALAIGGDDGAGPAVMITVENCGMTPEVREAVATALQTNGVKNERLVITVSHTHTGPTLKKWASSIFGSEIPDTEQAHIDQYAKELTEKMIQVARAALQSRRPGRLFRSEGKVGFAANRRVLEDGRWKKFGVQADGPVDHSMPMLVAKDENGKVITILANYACHCTTLGGNFNKIAGDWLGYASEIIEHENPGAVSLITIGCAADANPEPRRDDLKLCEQHGRAIADEVKRLLAADLKPVPADLTCKLTYIDLPFEPLPTKEQWRERTKLPGPAGYLAKKYLEMVEQGKEIPKTYSYPIGVWLFGDSKPGADRIEPPSLAMVFLAGEVVVDYAIRMKSEFDASRLWITAYANDVPCYIPSKRILREGGYEADSSMALYGRPARWAPEVEDMIVNAVQKLLPQTLYSPAKQADFPPPKSPKESLATIRVPQNFSVELVAAEPLIEDPVAFDWGPDGRLWVVEMRDYPNGLDWNGAGQPMGKPGGRVKILTDTDGDGRYDQATLFLDDIPFPTGVKVWRKGVLISAAPLVFYAEDTDGDGKADKRETLFEGFGEGNQQHRVNGLRWGIDNWLYLGNGDSGGSIKSTKTGQTINISGRDLRIRPDTGEMEAQAGQTQFGRCVDDWGNWFGGNNSNPLWHYVLDDHYLRRNPNVAPPENRNPVSISPGAARVYPTSRTLGRFNDFDRANRFTSACSPEVYRDPFLRFPYSIVPFRHLQYDFEPAHVFICEPVHNLVHHQVMFPIGITFTSRRYMDEQQSEFLTSTDNWFRPVMIRTGPDGALWIADMYRSVIEHPTWIPQDWQRRLDMRAGTNMGRIYKVVSAFTSQGSSTSRFTYPDKLELKELVDNLKSSNGWQRDMAQQLLIWRNDTSIVPHLEALVEDYDLIQKPNPMRRKGITKNGKPLARLHALATLDGLNALRPEIVIEALQDEHPGVVRHAIRLSEKFLKDEEKAKMFEKPLWNLVKHPDPFVQLQLAYSCGEATFPLAESALGRLLVQHQESPHFVAAVLSSLKKGNISPVFSEVVSERDKDAPFPAKAFEHLVAMAAALGDDSVIHRAMELMVPEPDGRYAMWQWKALARLLESLDRHKSKWDFLERADTQASLRKMFVAARKIAVDSNAPLAEREATIRLLGREIEGPLTQQEATNRLLRHETESRAADVKILSLLFSPRNPPEIQSAAVDALAQMDDNSREAKYAKTWPKDHQFYRPHHDQIAVVLLKDWNTHGPALRTQILDAVMSREERIDELFETLRDGRVPANQIDDRRRQQLLSHKNKDIRETAVKFFGTSSKLGRQIVLEKYASATTLPGDIERGKTLFAKKCAACHKLDGAGHAVGPDLASVGNKTPEALIVSLLDPNRAIEARYLDYIVVTEDGRQLSGMLGAETATSITLLGQEGKSVTVLRNQIDEIRNSGKSLMPEGLERDMSPQDLADVMAYIGGIGPVVKSFPGNKPAVISAGDGGSFRLYATTARISGPKIVFEEKYSNLGWWSSAEDRAVWNLEVATAGEYRVSFDYACANESAGNRFVVSVGAQPLGGVVEKSGSWDNYRQQSVGIVKLVAGNNELIVRSDGPPKGALFDLRSIRLEPIK